MQQRRIGQPTVNAAAHSGTAAGGSSPEGTPAPNGPSPPPERSLLLDAIDASAAAVTAGVALLADEAPTPAAHGRLLEVAPSVRDALSLYSQVCGGDPLFWGGVERFSGAFVPTLCLAGPCLREREGRRGPALKPRAATASSPSSTTSTSIRDTPASRDPPKPHETSPPPTSLPPRRPPDPPTPKTSLSGFTGRPCFTRLSCATARPRSSYPQWSSQGMRSWTPAKRWGACVFKSGERPRLRAAAATSPPPPHVRSDP